MSQRKNWHNPPTRSNQTAPPDKKKMPGTLIIITAPSGAGKTTLVRGLLTRDPRVQLSVSYTTRSPRSGEEHGRDYHFVDVDTFRRLRDQGEFLEWAEVHGNYYATSRVWIREQMADGRDIVLEIDWQGAQQVRKAFHDAVGVFILPPSFEVLETRLRGRGTDSDEVIARRLLAARSEMRHVGEFEHAIINNQLDEAVDDLVAVVRAARLRYANQRARYAAYFDSLEQD